MWNKLILKIWLLEKIPHRFFPSLFVLLTLNILFMTVIKKISNEYLRNTYLTLTWRDQFEILLRLHIIWKSFWANIHVNKFYKRHDSIIATVKNISNLRQIWWNKPSYLIKPLRLYLASFSICLFVFF